MKFRMNWQLLVVAVSILALAPTAGRADFKVYLLDVGNTTPLGPAPFGTVTVYDGADASASSGFLKIVFDLQGTTATTYEVGFNLKGSPAISNVTITTTGGSGDSFTEQSEHLDGFGDFAYGADGGNPNKDANTVSILFHTSGPATIDQFLVKSNGSAGPPDQRVYFAAEYNPHDTRLTTGFVGGGAEVQVVPAPATAIAGLSGALLIGLIGLVSYRRRTQAMLPA